MTAKLNDQFSTSSIPRISVALVLTALLIFSDVAAAASTPCNQTTNVWTTSSVSLQNPIETFAAATATLNGTSYLYVIGGFDCVYPGCTTGTPQTQVGHIQINSDGSLGTTANPNFTWQNLWSLPSEGKQPVGLSRDLCGATYTNAGKTFLYTVGGLVYDPVAQTSSLSTEVHYAQLNPTTGNLDSWSQAAFGLTVPQGAVGLDLQGTAVLKGYLYVIGGSTNNTSPPAGIQDTVYYAEINSSTGNLMGSAFTASPYPIEPTTKGIYKTCPVVDPATNTIYVVGGETGTSPAGTAEVWSAVQPQGGLGSLNPWVQENSLLNSPIKTDPLAAQAIVYNSNNNEIILMGGDTYGTGPDTALVEVGTVPSLTWSVSTLPSLPISNVIERNAGATNGNYIYSIGGEVTKNGNSSDSTAIYCLEL